MSTITTINTSDSITSSRAVINTNFSNLNTDKFETSNIDTDTALAANSDTKVASQKAVKTYIDTQGGANASETVRGIVEEATDAEVTAGTATGGTGAKLFITPAKLKSSGVVKFGGTGADGALSITSGATNIDCSNAKVVVKNYTSISITGTGSLTFTNPATNGTIIILKSQGAVTLTSSTAPMIAAQSMGAAGGAAATTGSKGWGFFVSNAAGIGGAATGTTAAPSGSLDVSSFAINGKALPLFCGAGGGGAGGGGGVGGRGGGGLYIECAGAFNFTTSAGISVAGGAATGGGGGGAGGSCIVLYGSLTANTGTITVAGADGGAGGFSGGAGGNGASGSGNGGTGGNSTNSSGSGGSGGASAYSASNGSNGTGGAGIGGGGGGASGLSLVASNTEFA